LKLNILFTSAVLFLMLIGLALGGSSPTQNISIGVLVDMTGDWSSEGNETVPALQIAAQDVNSYLKRIGSSKQVVLTLEDAGTDPVKAMRGLQNLNKIGIKVVIAATTSAELKAIKDYAIDNGIIIIGTTGTAPSLAIPDDNLIRLVPDDTNQGSAIARLFNIENLTAIVPITRGDIWGDDLLKAATKSFEVKGGKILEGVRYSPGTDFSREIRALSSIVKDAKSSYGSDKIGVYMISIGEAASLLALAARDPELSSVEWFGCDGVAGLESISQNGTLAQFAVKTGLVCPIYGVPSSYRKSDDYEYVAGAVMQKTGAEPNAYAITSYDALWAASESMMLSESLNSSELMEILIHTINRYSGITSRLKLNAAGDRRSASYDLVAVKEENGMYSWRCVGSFVRYADGNDELTWKGQRIMLGVLPDK
jgi:branched-chain amino acid transport system substrate-binding protein